MPLFSSQSDTSTSCYISSTIKQKKKAQQQKIRQRPDSNLQLYMLGMLSIVDNIFALSLKITAMHSWACLNRVSVMYLVWKTYLIQQNKARNIRINVEIKYDRVCKVLAHSLFVSQ